MKTSRALEALNFFMADVQAGIGPFLGVFLQARGWGTDMIGTVMSIGGIAGVILITFLALPVRGLIAASLIQAWGVWPVQALDGIGAGLQSVAVPALVVRLLDGTGRVNVGQGVVMTVQAGGAALSPALGGVLAHHFGYPAAFLSLAAISLGSLALWLCSGAGLRHACRTCSAPEDPPAPGTQERVRRV